ncbi:MAG: glycosyltransferase family protein [Bacteroidota bacterium]
MPRILTVIQARRGSSRLPDKVSMPVLDKSLLFRMVERVRHAQLAGTIVVATTTDSFDDPIETLCEQEGFLCFRGHPTDLLDRHYQAAKAFDAEVVIKIPSDCPLIDPRIIDQVIQVYLENEGAVDFVSNLHPATYPDGNDVEIMTFEALEIAWKEATRSLEREHTTPFIWENPDRFRLINDPWKTGKDYSMSHRWTIDYQEDYDFINAIYEALYPSNPIFSLEDIMELLAQQPDLFKINAHLAGVNWYRNHIDELKTIDATKTRHLNTNN